MRKWKNRKGESLCFNGNWGYGLVQQEQEQDQREQGNSGTGDERKQRNDKKSVGVESERIWERVKDENCACEMRGWIEERKKER